MENLRDSSRGVPKFSSDVKRTCPEIVEYLRFFRAAGFTERFEFHQDFAKTKEVDSVRTRHHLTFVREGQLDFSLERDMPTAQLTGE